MKRKSVLLFLSHHHIMGWLIPADQRHQLLADCRAKPTIQCASGASVQPPPPQVVAYVDANAVFRCNAVGPQSAHQIVSRVFSHITSSDECKRIVFVFDSNASADFPEQRAKVHLQRYPPGPPSHPEEIKRMLTKFGAKDEADLESTSAAFLSWITARDINWAVCFKCKPLKMFVWRLLTMAVRHVAVELTALGKLNCPVVIYSSTMAKIHVIAKHDCDPVPQPVRYMGEADPQIFVFAKESSANGDAVVIHSIDTDFILLAIGAIMFVPSALFLIRLKEGVTDVSALVQKFGGDCATARLNAFFWFLALGADYCKSLSTQGYATKALVELGVTNGNAQTWMEAGARAPNQVFAVETVGDKCTCTFSMRRLYEILDQLRRRKEPATKVRAPFVMAINEILFCVAYYGLMFDERIQPFPENPAISRGAEGDTCIISWQLR